MSRRRRFPLTAVIVLAAGLALAVAGAPSFALRASAQPADCVSGLSLCAQECDLQTKPGNPDRPQCARGCVSKYQTCERIQLLQQSTGGPALNQGKAVAPAQ